MVDPSLEEPKSSLDGYELPCGFLDVEGNLHTDIVVRELTGEDEEVLASRNMQPTKKINKILARCTDSIGPYSGPSIAQIVPELTQGDRVYLLMAIRRASLGDEMPFRIRCEACDQESQLIIDLSELEVKKMRDPTIRQYDIELPSSGSKVRMKVLIGRGEDAISKASSRGVDILTTAMFCRVESLDGKPVTMKDLKRMSLKDRNFIRDSWEEYEGGIDTEVTVDCASCGHEYETDLEISQEGFFNPSAALKSWKRKSSS